MWVFFENGTFYSAIQDWDDDNKKWVRARDKRSADIFARWVGDQRGKGVKVIKMKKADYLYRVEATHDEWADYVAEQVDNARATNFKTEVARNVGHGSRFVKALHNVWWEMVELQRDAEGGR